MQRTRLQIICIIFAACQVNLFAQEDQSVYSHLLFDEKNAWRSSAQFINDINIGSDSRLWIGSDNGLVCWDGNTKLIYDNSLGNQFTLNGDRVHDIFELKSGDILLLTQQEEKQIELLRKGARSSETISRDENGQPIKGYLSDVIMSENRTVFAAYNEGFALAVYGLTGSTLTLNHRFNFGIDITKDVVKIASHQDVLWVAVKGEGVWRSEGERQELVMDFRALPESNDLNPKQFFSDNEGRFWLVLEGTEENVYLWNQHKFEVFDSPNYKAIDKIDSDNDGGLLFVSGEYPNPIEQVFLFDNNQWMDYSAYVDSSFVEVYPFQSFKNSFLAVTKDNIVHIEFKKESVKKYLHQKLDLTKWGHIIMGIEEDEQGNIYFLSETDLYRLDKKTDEVVEIPVVQADGTPLDFNCGSALHLDTNGQLWFKVCIEYTSGILVRYEPSNQNFSLFHMPDLIKDIDIDSAGKIWIVHHNAEDLQGSLSWFDTKTETFNSPDLISFFAEPRFCYAANDSMLWLGTRKGLVSFNSHTNDLKVFTTENSALVSDHIITIEQGPGNWLMTGTFGDGLQLFDPETNKIRLFNHNNGLVNDYVCGILEVDSSRYWLSTFEGLSYFDLGAETFSNFTMKDGFTHYEFNRFAYFLSKDSTCYFGTVNGVSAFKSKDLIVSDYAANIGLSEIKKYYGESDTLIRIRNGLGNVSEIYLEPGLTYLELSFYADDYIKAGHQNVYTKLTPYDDDWVFAAEKKVRYRLLPPGDYELQVKGQYSPKTLKLKLIVQTPFYKTWWFILLLMGVLIGITVGIYQYRLSKLREEEEARIEVNRKFAELELQALQAQLNPHFVFNALGAIQHTIRDGDRESAEHFLTSFAVLMRLFLESSKKKRITLSEEIELIRRYVELERLRFENRFDFVFDVNETIDIQSTEIPSLLFQPFVENAINHGLFHRKEKGLLTIRINEENETLLCSIEDNGVGRKKAAEIRKKSLRKFPSRSTQIVNERLEILRKVEGLDLKIDIIDLPQDTGTKVLIEIPLGDS